MTILSLLLLIHLDRAVKSLICLNPGFNVNSVPVVMVTNWINGNSSFKHDTWSKHKVEVIPVIVRAWGAIPNSFFTVPSQGHFLGMTEKSVTAIKMFL